MEEARLCGRHLLVALGLVQTRSEHNSFRHPFISWYEATGDSMDSMTNPVDTAK